MEHGRYPYSALPERPRLRWPDDARVAVMVVPNLEHYRYDLTWTPMYAKQPSIFPDLREFGWRDYGVRVGVWRLMETMDRHSVRGTVALNSDVCHLYPQIAAGAVERQWELMGHGRHNTERVTGLSEDDERRLIRETLDTIHAATGQQPRGWLGPALTETAASLDLLAEEGIRYVCDWANDDQPFEFRVRKNTIFAMPYSPYLNDVHFYLRHGRSAEDFSAAIVSAFKVLYEEGPENGRVLPIAVHPHLSGQPMWAAGLNDALAALRQYSSVWWATGGEILDWYLHTMPRTDMVSAADMSGDGPTRG